MLDVVGQDLVEAELSQVHRINLAEVCAGLHAPRHILALLRNMPPDTRTAQIWIGHLETLPDPEPARRPVRDPKHKYLGWSPVFTTQVELIEQIRLSRYEYAQSVSSKTLPKFVPRDIPRSRSDESDGRKRASMYDLARQNHELKRHQQNGA